MFSKNSKKNRNFHFYFCANLDFFGIIFFPKHISIAQALAIFRILKIIDNKCPVNTNTNQSMGKRGIK